MLKISSEDRNTKHLILFVSVMSMTLSPISNYPSIGWVTSPQYFLYTTSLSPSTSLCSSCSSFPPVFTVHLLKMTFSDLSHDSSLLSWLSHWKFYSLFSHQRNSYFLFHGLSFIRPSLSNLSPIHNGWLTRRAIWAATALDNKNTYAHNSPCAKCIIQLVVLLFLF